MPMDKGSAIKKTTTEGGTSFATSLSLSFSEAIPHSFAARGVPGGSYITGARLVSSPIALVAAGLKALDHLAELGIVGPSVVVA